MSASRTVRTVRTARTVRVRDTVASAAGSGRPWHSGPPRIAHPGARSVEVDLRDRRARSAPPRAARDPARDPAASGATHTPVTDEEHHRIARPRTTARPLRSAPQQTPTHTAASSHAAQCSTRKRDRGSYIGRDARRCCTSQIAVCQALGEIAMCEALACDFCLSWTSSSCSSQRLIEIARRRTSHPPGAAPKGP